MKDNRMTYEFQQQKASRDKQQRKQLCRQKQYHKYTRMTYIQGKGQNCLLLLILPSSRSTEMECIVDQFFLQDENNIIKSDVFECIKTIQPTYIPVDLHYVCSDQENHISLNFKKKIPLFNTGLLQKVHTEINLLRGIIREILSRTLQKTKYTFLILFEMMTLQISSLLTFSNWTLPISSNIYIYVCIYVYN